MKHSDRNPKQTRNRSTRLGAAVAALLTLGLLAASSASAAYEQVGNFAGNPGELHPFVYAAWPEKAQLGGTSGMAVNYTGAGGVPAGTIYATDYFLEGSVARFNPDGSFSERWTFFETPGFQERCGPDGEAGHPVCASEPRGSDSNKVDVDVDETTGYVYVLGSLTSGQKNLIHVYSADGSELIAEFGERAASGETTTASPQKIHEVVEVGGIAVDGDGNVYVADFNGKGRENERLMVFRPQSPGDYEHYVYAGQEHDITAELGFGSEFEFSPPSMPVTDTTGHVYVGRDKYVAVLDPAHPSAAPICQFKKAAGGIDSITVNPLSGEVFYHTYKDGKVHQLAPCDPETGQFAERGAFAYAPLRTYLKAMALDPLRKAEPSRPPGVLYAGSPNGEGGKGGEDKELLTESAMGFVFAPPVEAPPVVLSESISHVTDTTAALGAHINPKGPPTRYAFQYETQAQYEANEPADRFAGATEAPLGGGFLGEGPLALSAITSLTGLEPDTAYRYRAVATSHCSVEDEEKLCEAVGPDQSFHTFPAEAPGLPDRRAYELVSPPRKEGGQVWPAEPSIASCQFETCKPGETSAKFPLQSTPDGEAIAYQGSPFARGEGAITTNQYIAHRDAKVGWQTTNPTPALLNSRISGYLAFDPALSRGVLLQAEGPPLSSEAPVGYQDLYTQPTADPATLGSLLSAEPPHRSADDFRVQYGGASADLSRIFFSANDALSEETPFAPEAKDGGANKVNLYEWHEDTLSLVNVAPGNTETEAGASFDPGSAHAISADGSRVFFEDEAHQVYIRVNGEETLEVPDHAGHFLAASVDGSKLLLTDGALYEDTGNLAAEPTDLTEGKGGFKGVVGESEDLSHIYFVDTAVLSGAEANEYGDEAEEGKPNLYAWAQGGGTTYVTTLLETDNGVNPFDISRSWAFPPGTRTAEASPQGRYVAFISRASLTGYDNEGPCGVAALGKVVEGPCAEVFLYDSATGRLGCPSCNPSGAAPLGLSVLRQGRAGETARYLTDEGRLYFDSRDALSPFDTNEGAEDVYEYEPNGVGSCERANGCVYLISAGSEPYDSNLVTIDEDGSDVFFTTRDRLTLKDTDDVIDLYDAREDGGIPGESETSRGECQGEACQPQVSPPNDPTPGSSTFEGAGNVDEKKTTKKHKHKKKRHAKKKSHKRAAKHDRGGSK